MTDGGVRLHCAPLVLPVCAPPLRDGAVAVRGASIVDVGPRAVLAARHDAPVRDWPGVLTPGLVNAHTHLQYSGLADLAGRGLAFDAWLAEMIAARARLRDADWARGVQQGAEAAVRAGTTTVADVASDPPAVAALAASPLAGTSYVEVVGADARRWTAGRRAALLAGLDAAPADATLGLSPHSLYAVAREVLADLARVARARGLRLHVHLGESAAESELVRTGSGPLAAAMQRQGLDLELVREGGSGRGPAAELDAAGLLGTDCHVAHGVHLDAADRALLRRRGTAVALCVRSNRTLGVGEPPVADYLAEGAPLALGTDSLASSPSLDLWEEAAAVAALARAQGAASDGLAQRMVQLVTVSGARALGHADRGELRPGLRADLAVFDVPATEDGVHDELLRSGGGRCVATVVAGRTVHEAVPA